MAQTDRVVQIRAIQGINRQEDSRLGDPGSWWATENMFGRSPGVLAKRPGSRVFMKPSSIISSPAPDVTATQLGAGETIDFGEAVDGGLLEDLKRAYLEFQAQFQYETPAGF